MKYRFLPLFFLSVCLVVVAGDNLINPDDPAYLRRQFAYFEKLPVERQEQLRILDREFAGLNTKDQERFSKTLQTYNAWLAKLPEPERKRILDAGNSEERLNVVREIRTREYLEGLPKAYRDEYAKLQDPKKQAEKIREWRYEEQQRQDDWDFAKDHFNEWQPGKPLPMFQGNEKQLVEKLVANLDPSLSEVERESLRQRKLIGEVEGHMWWYAREILLLYEAHPLLPGKPGPKDYKSLPVEVRTYLEANDKTFGAGRLPPEVQKVEGRWPDFALALHKYCETKKLKLPVPLGDCRKDQMPDDIREYLTKVLEPHLNRNDMRKKLLTNLQSLEGKWPEYPKTIMELAKSEKLPIPGWSLPLGPTVWERFRKKKADAKPAN